MHARAEVRPLRMLGAAAIDGNDAVLVNHLVAERHRVLALDDLVEAAVAGRHHRRRDAARDATIVEAEILVAVERSDRVDVAADAAAKASGRPARALAGFVCQRRNPAVWRIDDEPGRAVPAVEGVEDQMCGRTQTARELGPGDSGVELLVAPLVGRREFLGRDVLELLAVELRRALDRDSGLVVVRINALELRVAPRRLRRRI